MVSNTARILPAELSRHVADRVALYRCRLQRRHPRTFNEKLLYKMVWDRRPLLVTFADKIACADYIASRIGPGYTAEHYVVTDDLASVRRSDLPENLVVKNSHLSGGVVVVFDGAPPDAQLQSPDEVFARRAVQPGNLDWDRLVEVSEAWIARTYATDPCGERMYGPVPKRVIVEELVLNPDGGLPDDLRFFVFNGRCRMVRAAGGIVCGTKTVDEFKPDWTPIDVTFVDEDRIQRSPVPIPAPERLAEMIELAETLASESDFLRVDMFKVADRIVIGELTNFPSAGNARWDPPDLDAELGACWRQPRRYRGS